MHTHICIQFCCLVNNLALLFLLLLLLFICVIFMFLLLFLLLLLFSSLILVSNKLPVLSSFGVGLEACCFLSYWIGADVICGAGFVPILYLITDAKCLDF